MSNQISGVILFKDSLIISNLLMTLTNNLLKSS